MVGGLEVVAEVPLTEVRGGVAGFLEGFSQGEVFWLQTRQAVGIE